MSQPKDYSGKNLRGENFKGQDLTGANFSSADIRGANFTNAILRGANFSHAKAGLHPYWAIGLIITSLILSAISGFASGIVTTFARYWFIANKSIDQHTIFLGVIVLIILLVLIFISFIFTIRQNLDVSSKTLAWTLTVAISGPLAGALALAVFGYRVRAWALVVTWAGGFAVAGALALAVGSALARAVIWVEDRTWSLVRSLALAVAVSGAFALARYWALNLADPGNSVGAGAWAGALTVALPSGYISWLALIGDEKFTVIKKVAVAFSTIKATSFHMADLTDADFTQATLKTTDFRKANLTRTRFYKAQKLDCARVGNTILANLAVLKLLVSGNGRGKSYVGANLKGANLIGVDLTEANLKEADISEATFQGACLERANLTLTQAVSTDFTKAQMTGACVEAWNIESTTKLDNVDCRFVYLLEKPKPGTDDRERRPSSGEFQSGEFTKLFEEVLHTVDFIFRNGVDWKAFVAAFKKVQIENEGMELAIQSIENKGDGVVVVRVSVPADVDKEKIHSDFTQNYQLALKEVEKRYKAELQAKDKEIQIYRQQSSDMKEIVGLLASRPVNVNNEVKATAESKAMSDSIDKSRKIEIGSVGRDFNASGQALNLGDIDISGVVTNTIDQLPESPEPEKPGIKELLSQLQAAIEAEPNLSEEDQAEALEQVKTLAEVGQKPEEGVNQKAGKTAMKILKGTVASLPSAAALVEACNKLLPMISKLIGLA